MFLPGSPAHPGASDEDLAARYRSSGELALLGELYARYLSLTYGVCFQYLRDDEASKDAVMSLFEKLVKDLRRHEVQRFAPWLYATARNYCLMQLRAGKSRREQPMSHLTNGADVEIADPLHHQELEALHDSELEALRVGLSELPTAQQRCLRLFYLENYSYQQVATNTGYSLGQVKSALQNGRRMLRQLLTVRT
ncbi:MAG: sigma-70 family RNA polymerase sigma factor [Hymenobacteraceae bacterium]|nr:sigma-70 family RNA polymerase sigma factor [Hymenobacteraceae bacterium]